MEVEIHVGTEPLFEVFGIGVIPEIVTMWVLILLIGIGGFLLTRRMQRIPSGAQNVAEFAAEAILDQVIVPAFGDRRLARKYLPFLGTLFIFILISNYSGLLPGAGELPGFKAPTSNLGVTVGLAVIAFIATHVTGVREHGLGYLKRFIEPMPFMLPLNVMEEFIRPLSLSLRLFGNIFGEEAVLVVLLALAPWFIPVPLMALDLLFGFLQAYIFTILTAVYISGALAEGH